MKSAFIASALFASGLFASASPALAQMAEGWKDSSPHAVKMVTVEDGVQLEVLDWGGKGRPLLLLAGLSDTAHVFDDFAPTLTRKFHVYAITRRGFGISSAPRAGDSYPKLADDIVRVIDELHLEKPLVAGHSFAGEEMHLLGSRHHAKIAGLFYIDAAFNRGDNAPAYAAKMREMPPAPTPLPSDMASMASFRAFAVRNRNAVLPEAEVRVLYNVNVNGSIVGRAAPSPVVRKVYGDMMSSVTKNYNPAPLVVPAMAIYAAPDKVEDLLSRYNATDPVLQQKVSELFVLTRARNEQQAAWFRTLAGGSAKVLTLPGQHHLFVTNAAEVRSAIEKFASTLR